MATEREKKLFVQVSQAFDIAAPVLQAIAQEIVNLEPKLGSSSKVIAAKRDQLGKLSNLYDSCLQYINLMREINHAMWEEFTSQELQRHKKESGLTYLQLAELWGESDPVVLDGWKKCDEWDARLKRIYENTGQPPPYDGSFEQFIAMLRRGSPVSQISNAAKG